MGARTSYLQTTSHTEYELIRDYYLEPEPSDGLYKRCLIPLVNSCPFSEKKRDVRLLNVPNNHKKVIHSLLILQSYEFLGNCLFSFVLDKVWFIYRC
jgi:hypothetical protein